MDKESFVEECLSASDEEHERGEAENEEDNEEDEVVLPALNFSDSDDDVNDGEFEFDKNTPERVAIGLNSDPVVEEAHLAAGDTEIQSDDTYYPSSEKLQTDYSSGEENNYMFSNFVPKKELFDPKFKVGKTFNDMELFRKVVRNHGVVSRCNFRFRPNDNRRAQAVCKLGCKWRIWASLNKSWVACK
ncbi:Uncharacterized protein Adt_28847 [Abeliophyllum distichum]|uniref:Transposase MuDR plant domain-containing protein n=1 Tax=Abeliophyllum distichum TaxID=126358 RepID=A0ABD1RXP6_9LAMI